VIIYNKTSHKQTGKVDKIESYTAVTVEVNGVSLPVGRGYRSLIEKLS
jgi:hypothetical protein